jgi:hypothetical protein
MCLPAIAAAISSVGTALSGAFAGATAAAGAAGAAGAATAGAAGAAAAGAGAAAAAPSLFSLQGLSMIGQAASGVMSFVSSQNQAKAMEQVARNNQTMAEYEAVDAQRRGEEAAQEALRRTRGLGGTQRAMMAARGLDLSSGTPAELLMQTEMFGEQDVNTARFNAAREAWATRADAANQTARARIEASRMRSEGAMSLLGSAGAVADKWQPFRRPARVGVV